MTNKERALRDQAVKLQIIEAFAEYLVANQAGKSIALQMEQQLPRPVNWAHEWMQVRSACQGLVGYPSKDEAVAYLLEKMSA